MKIIACINEKGGSGKSTIACNLATALHRRGQRVVLIDADPQGTARDWRAASPEGADLPPVVADPVLVEQVLINLIRNACDALAEKEADANMASEATGQRPKKILVQVRAAGDKFARIDVTDNATGLKGQTIESLCQPFFTTKTEGMGMGLAICRSIIEAHQGVLDASDVQSGGACFSLSLPLMTPASRNETPVETPIPALET